MSEFLDILRDTLAGSARDVVDFVKPDPVQPPSLGLLVGDKTEFLKQLLEFGGETAMQVGSVGGKKAAGKGAAKVAEGFTHGRGGASIEAMARDAGGTRFFKVDRAGKATPVLSNAEDAAMRLDPTEALVRVTPNGEQIVEGGQVVGKRMSDAIGKLTPGASRDVGEAAVHNIGDETIDSTLDFLSKLGVEF